MQSELLRTIWSALDAGRNSCEAVEFTGAGALRSAFAVTDFAAASIGAAHLALAEYIERRTRQRHAVTVDRRRASLWFGRSIDPHGWSLPPVWDAFSGDYATKDGWIRLHTNAAHHRAAALSVLGLATGKEAMRELVADWQADALEAEIVSHGGCAAVMRDAAEWACHKQGKCVADEPLVIWSGDERHNALLPPASRGPFDPKRPLAGVRVLDLTRILAGPVATRFLAGFGAEVLRIDPPGWDEPSLAPEVTLGKRCARLDLKQPAGRQHLIELLTEADILVHGYRPGALQRLGLDALDRNRIRPGLIDISLDAYGWSGPWAGRRGFDSLVQMSCGIADAGMRHFGNDRPTPLPVQALDHGTGYIMAAACLRLLTKRQQDGAGGSARVSLARTALLLTQAGSAPEDDPISPPEPADYQKRVEVTGWGAASRLLPAASLSGIASQWDRPASALGSSPPVW